MTNQVQFYVNAMHSIGGVTTWSFQAATFLATRYQTRVVTVNSGTHAHGELFPGQVMEVWRRASAARQANDGPHAGNDKQPLPERPIKPTRPTKRETKPQKVTRPDKPTKPLKPTKLPAQSINDREQSSQVVRKAEVHEDDTSLHRSAERAMRTAALFIPNYLDFAYELAARSRAMGIPSRCIGICHCDQENYYRQLVRYAPIIQSFIAVSPRCLQNLQACLPHRASDMHLLPYGVLAGTDRERFAASPRSSGPIRLLYAGRLAQRQKRIFDLVELARELNARGIDYRLDIVGVGPDRESLATELSGVSRVQFYPGVSHSQMSDVYRDHDVFLLPSETEGTSIALLESMAHGLVPVATLVSGSEDVIVDRVNGFLYPVGDVRSMAAAISLLADDELLRRQMAMAAIQTVTQSYRSESQLSAFERCVQQTMEKPLATADAAQSVL